METDAERSARTVVAQPTGTVTFLFTDIEGSTVRWQRDSAAMNEALRRHDALIARAVESKRGYVFKSVGDSICAAFSNADDAVAAAFSAQKALRTGNWEAVDGLRVRMAIHSGSSVERDGDYLGLAPTISARLLATAHGGQTVLSGVAIGLVSKTLPEGAALRDLGEHRLDDIRDPVRVYELWEIGNGVDFPPLRSHGSLPNNMPPERTPFIGRDDIVSAVAALVTSVPLVALVGSGGVGKTRIAVRVALALLPTFEDGAWFVDLATSFDERLVVDAVCAAVGVPPSLQKTRLDVLTAYLNNMKVLLVFDNCEHLVAEAARVVDALLRNCRSLRVLATSREPLAVAGEHVYRVPPLPVPPQGLVTTADEAQSYASVALFVDRAQATGIGFRLTDENASTVAAICRRLDGIALAIELAASRTRAFSVDVIERRLRERFALLTSSSRAALPRQVTMRSLIDWSYELLDDEERTLFRRVAIFGNGFTLDAVFALAVRDDVPEDVVVDCLSALVDKSLVNLESASSGTGRYRLSETLREYALLKLADAGEREGVLRALATWSLDVAERSHEAWISTPSADWESEYASELENFRAVLTWALHDGRDVALGRRLTALLRHFWSRVDPFEGERWIRAAREASGLPLSVEVAAALSLCDAEVHLALRQLPIALEAARAAFKSFAALENDLGYAEASGMAGYCLALLGSVSDAFAMLDAAADAYRRCNETQQVARMLTFMGVAHFSAGNMEDARVSLELALHHYRASDNHRGITGTAANLAELEYHCGNLSGAVALVEEAVALDQTSREAALVLANHSAYLIAMGRFVEARLCARESAALAKKWGGEVDAVFALQHLSAGVILDPEGVALASRSNAIGRAARLLGYVDRRLRDVAGTRGYTELHEYERARQRLGEEVDAHMLLQYFDEGSQWNERRAFDEALKL